MSRRPGLLSEISWFQVVVSALAAVTAAWIASSLGVAGTLIGAALGSFVVTISSAFYGRTLDRGKTLIVQTASGTSVERTLVDGEIAATLDEVAEQTGSPVNRAEVVNDGPRRLHWRTIVATTVVVLAVALAAMGAYELVTGDSYGAKGDNARIGNPFGGSSSPDEPTPSSTPTDPAATGDPTPQPSATQPAPTATAPEATVPTTPAPTATATPRPSVTPTTPTESTPAP